MGLSLATCRRQQVSSMQRQQDITAALARLQHARAALERLREREDALRQAEADRRAEARAVTLDVGG